MLNFFKLNCAILTDCADCGKTQGRTLTQREKLRRRVSVDELRAWSLVDNSYEAHHAVERHRNNQHRNRLRFNRSGKNTPSKNSARPVWNPSSAASALRTTHFESTIYPAKIQDARTAFMLILSVKRSSQIAQERLLLLDPMLTLRDNTTVSMHIEQPHA